MRRRIGLALVLGVVACGGTDASACSWRNGGCRAYGYVASPLYGYYAPPVVYYRAPRAYYYAPPPVYYAPLPYGYARYRYYYGSRVYRSRFQPVVVGRLWARTTGVHPLRTSKEL